MKRSGLSRGVFFTISFFFLCRESAAAAPRINLEEVIRQSELILLAVEGAPKFRIAAVDGAPRGFRARVDLFKVVQVISWRGGEMRSGEPLAVYHAALDQEIAAAANKVGRGAKRAEPAALPRYYAPEMPVARERLRKILFLKRDEKRKLWRYAAPGAWEAESKLAEVRQRLSAARP